MAAKRRETSPKKRRKSKANDPSETVDTLGYRRLAEGPPRSRIVTFGDILPDVIAKYGLGRKISIARFETTFRQIVCDLFPHAPLYEERENGNNGSDREDKIGDPKGNGRGPEVDYGGNGGKKQNEKNRNSADGRKNGNKTGGRDLFSDLPPEERGARQDGVGKNGAETDGGSFGFFNEQSFRLIGFRAGTVQIEVANAPLLSEWTFYEEEILRRFQTAMPDEKIRKIRFTLR